MQAIFSSIDFLTSRKKEFVFSEKVDYHRVNSFLFLIVSRFQKIHIEKKSAW